MTGQSKTALPLKQQHLPPAVSNLDQVLDDVLRDGSDAPDRFAVRQTGDAGGRLLHDSAQDRFGIGEIRADEEVQVDPVPPVDLPHPVDRQPHLPRPSVIPDPAREARLEPGQFLRRAGPGELHRRLVSRCQFPVTPLQNGVFFPRPTSSSGEGGGRGAVRPAEPLRASPRRVSLVQTRDQARSGRFGWRRCGGTSHEASRGGCPDASREWVCSSFGRLLRSSVSREWVCSSFGRLLRSSVGRWQWRSFPAGRDVRESAPYPARRNRPAPAA